MDMDKFEDIINDFLTENEVNILFTMPKGTQDVIVKDNTGLGAVVHFYFILKAICPIFRAMQEQMGLGNDPAQWVKIVDSLLGMVRGEILPEEGHSSGM